MWALFLPFDKTNPPNTRTASIANEPNKFATIKMRPIAAMNRNSPDAIWFTHTSKRNILNNLKKKYYQIVKQKILT